MRPRLPPPLGIFVARAREEIVQGVSLRTSAGIIGLPGAGRPRDEPRVGAGVFIPPEGAFPGLAPTKETLQSLLSELDVDEALFTAARLNLILSDQLRTETDSWWRRQQ